MEAQTQCWQRLKGPITAKAEQIKAKFHALLDKTNKEHPKPKDVKARSDLLVGSKSLELWRSIASAGYLAELTVIENASYSSGEGMLEASASGAQERTGRR